MLFNTRCKISQYLSNRFTIDHLRVIVSGEIYNRCRLSTSLDVRYPNVFSGSSYLIENRVRLHYKNYFVRLSA